MPYPYSYDYEAQQKEKERKPAKLKTNRNMWKLMLFNVLTLGIYSIVFFIPLSYDLDKVDPKRERSKTMNYALAFLISLFTFSIVLTIWHYHIAQRIEDALARRNIDYDFSTSDFWGWYFFGSFILVGTFVYFHKLCKAMNLLCESYNENPSVSE